MAVLRDLSYARPMSTYVPMDFKPLDELGQGLETKYKENEAKIAQARAALKGLTVRTPYQPLVDQTVSDTRDQLAALASRPDLENIGRDLTDVVTKFDENDTVRMALKDKAEYDLYKKTQQTRVGAKENGIRQTQFDRALKLSESQNNEIKYDKNGKPITVFQGYNAVENQDISTDMMKMIENWKASKSPLVYKDSKGNKQEYTYGPNGYFNVSTQTYVDEAEVANALRMVVTTNPKYAELIQEEATFKIHDVTGGQSFTLAHLKELGITEDQLDKFLKEQSIKPEAKENPAFLEGLAEAMIKTQIADGYIQPAAAKAGFTEIEPKYLTDNVLMEGLEAANRFNLEKYKQDRTDRREDKKAQNAFDAGLTISNEGVISTTEQVPVEKILENVKEKEARLKEIERNLAAHSNGNGTGNYSDLVNEKNQLNTEIATAKGTYNTKSIMYKETADFNLFVDNEYKNYLKLYDGNIGVPKLTRAEFIAELDKPYTNNDRPAKTPNVYAYSGSPIMSTNAVKPMNTKEKQNFLQNKIIDAASRYKTNVNSHFTKSTTGPNPVYKGESFNLLNEPDLKTKSGTIRKLNELHTQHALRNGGEYRMAESGISLDQAMAVILKKNPELKEEDLVREMTITDGELESGFPFAYTVTNKKTGEKILQEYVIPANGGADERSKTGVYLMNNSKPTGSTLDQALAMASNGRMDDTFEQGLAMASSAAFPQLSKTKLAPQLSSVNDNSSSNTRPAVSAPIQVGAGSYRVVKRRHTYKNAEGNPIGTNTVYEMVREGKEPVVDKSGNFLREKVDNYIVNQTVPKDSPREEKVMFRSLDDVRRAVYLLSK